MFGTSSMEIVKYCQDQFNLALPSVTLARRTVFLYKLNECDNRVIKMQYVYKQLKFYIQCSLYRQFTACFLLLCMYL